MENIIQEKLFALRDEKFSKFQRRLMPTVSPETVIGVRTPAIRELVKEIKGTDEARSFIKDLPHEYFDENQLHALLLSQESEYETDGISVKIHDISRTIVIKLMPKLSIPILLMNNFSVEYQSTKLKKNLPEYSGSSLFMTALFIF